MDDRIGTAAVAFGMTGTPFYVVLDGDNGILGRFSGEVGVAGLDGPGGDSPGQLSHQEALSSPEPVSCPPFSRAARPG